MIEKQPAVLVYPEVGAQLTGRNDGLHPSVNDTDDDIPLDKLVGLLDKATHDEARELDAEIMQIIGSLGGNSGKYGRERGRAMNAILSEIYSPPRVSAIAKRVRSRSDDPRRGRKDLGLR